MCRKISYTIVLLAAVGAAYLAGSWRGPREIASAASAGAPPPLVSYRCPMHPDFTSEHADTRCGLCGMALERVEAGDPPSTGAARANATAPVAVTAERQQLIGVTTDVVAETSGIDEVRVFGRVTSDETRVHRLTAGLEGFITEVSAVTTGAYVTRGQWLATYAAADSRIPISAYVTAVNVLDREQQSGNTNPASLGAAQASVALATDRLRGLGMSPLQIEELRKTRAVGTAVSVTSPIDGFVLARSGPAGQRFDAGAELFQIADLSRVWILADFPAASADAVEAGTPVRVRVGGRPIPVRARVSRAVLPQFDRETQSFKLRVESDNPGFVLRPDMLVDVDLEVPFASTILVPIDAVIASGLRTHVFVERGSGVFEPREIETGRRHGGRVAVMKGLRPGERIATSGTFLLDSESRMKGHDRARH